MRKKSTRLVSAALAVCMMASTLPVSAFAAAPAAASTESSASAQDETKAYHLNGGETLNDTFVTANGSVYELGGGYAKSITIETTKNITLNIVSNVDVNMGSALLNVKNAGVLMINAGQNEVVAKVKNSDAAAFMKLNASNATVVVQNGRYLNSEQERDSIFTIVAGTLELNDVYISYDTPGMAVLNGGTVHIRGGELNNSKGTAVYNGKAFWDGIELGGTVTIENAKINGSVRNCSGSMEITNCTLKGKDSCLVVDGGNVTFNNVNVSFSGGGNGTLAWLHGTSDDGKKGELIFNGGTYESIVKCKKILYTQYDDFDITLDNITIKNAECGVCFCLTENNKLTIKNVIFDGNDTDIYVYKNRYVTIDPTFTDEAKIEVQDPYEGRQITTRTSGKAYQKNLKLTSANPGYVIGYKKDYRGEYRYLTRGYYVDSEKAVATAEINGELNQLDSTKLIAKDTEVTLKAADTAPKGKEFKGWKLYKVVNDTETEITDETELSKLLENGTKTTATLTMPAYNVKAEPYYSNIPYNITPVDCTVDKPEAAMGDTVTATRREPEANEHFVGWTVKVGGEEQKADTFLTPDANDPAKVSFTMPNKDVEVKANFEKDTIEPIDPIGPSDTDYGGDIAAGVVIGGIAAVGAYEVGTGLYRITQMDDVAMPTNRLALAKLMWERAGKPEPETLTDETLYSDMDAEDTDAQKAARWAVEQELLKDDTNEDEQKFHPAFPVSKLRVCLTWEKAKQKGLFDTAAE